MSRRGSAFSLSANNVMPVNPNITRPRSTACARFYVSSSVTFSFMNRITLPSKHAQLAVFVLGTFAIILMASCTGSTEQDAQSVSVPTSAVASATATPELSVSEDTQASGANDVLPDEQATTVPATVIAQENTPTVRPSVEPTPTPAPTSTPVPRLAPQPPRHPPPPRAIAINPVNRIAFGDGRCSIFTVNSDGSDLVAVAGGAVDGGDLLYKFLVWSPDGGSLAFSSIFVVGGAITETSYHRADADGNGDV